MSNKNKFDINYWLRKVYTSSIYQKLNPNKDRVKKQVFTSIYKSNHWVQKDETISKNSISVSGHGSNVNTNQFFNLKKIFTKIIDDKNINSVLDMPCGDFLWFYEIIKHKNINYSGVDIVEELIEANKEKYQNKNFDFINDDIVNFNTNKKFDLILIRDLFIHIQNSDIKKIIQNIKKMDFRYVALNSYNNNVNYDVIVGKHRKVNLLIEPFNLVKPLEYFKDHEDDKYIFLYEKKNFIQNLKTGGGIKPLISS
jgi:2-polyprenyl-3-methyl-5-hydroxy-6-metoxy-1,4-benzoquinol methylase